LSYEKLLNEAYKNDIVVKELKFESSSKGLIKNNKIAIRNDITTTNEKACILAEEIGHYFTTHGDILDQTKTENRRQEKRARNWAYEKLVPLDKVIEAYDSGVRNRFELALYLDVIEEFLEEAIIHYKEKYGIYVVIGNYIVYFDPLGIYKKLE
jgi:Zn-dependent peptidase ImmA (M78 family)